MSTSPPAPRPGSPSAKSSRRSARPSTTRSGTSTYPTRTGGSRRRPWGTTQRAVAHLTKLWELLRLTGSGHPLYHVTDAIEQIGGAPPRSLRNFLDTLYQGDTARAHLQRALDLFDDLTDPIGQARTHLDLTLLSHYRARPAEALTHAHRAFDLYQAAGHQTGQAKALHAIGLAHARLGNQAQALAHCQRALGMLAGLGDHYGQAAILDDLGRVHYHLGHHSQALAFHQRAIDLYHSLNDHHDQAEALVHLGDTHHAAGHPEHARNAWQQALTILDDLDHPATDQVRAKLHHLDADTNERPTT